MEILNLSYNNISTIDDGILEMTKQKTLLVDGNFIIDIPVFLYQSNITRIDLEWPYYLPEIHSITIMSKFFCDNTKIDREFNYKSKIDKYVAMTSFKSLLKKSHTHHNKRTINIFDFFKSYGHINHPENTDNALHMMSLSLAKFHPGIAQSFIKSNPELLNMKDSKDNTPIYQAAKTNNLELMDLIIKNKPDFNIGSGTKKGTIVHTLLRNQPLSIEIFKKIFASGFDTNTIDEKENTPLHLLMGSFIKYQKSAVIIGKKLLECKAQPNQINLAGKTPLIIAAERNQRVAIKFAIDWNTISRNNPEKKLKLFDLNAPNTKNGYTALHYACSIPSISMINDLTSDKMTHTLQLNNNFEMASQVIPKEYLTSKKQVIRHERKAILARYRRRIKQSHYNYKSIDDNGYNLDFSLLLDSDEETIVKTPGSNDFSTAFKYNPVSKVSNPFQSGANNKFIKNMPPKAGIRDSTNEKGIGFEDVDSRIVDEDITVSKLPNSFAKFSMNRFSSKGIVTSNSKVAAQQTYNKSVNEFSPGQFNDQYFNVNSINTEKKMAMYTHCTASQTQIKKFQHKESFINAILALLQNVLNKLIEYQKELRYLLARQGDLRIERQNRLFALYKIMEKELMILHKTYNIYCSLIANPFRLPNGSAIYTALISWVKNMGATQIVLGSHQTSVSQQILINQQNWHKILCTQFFKTISMKYDISKYGKILQKEIMEIAKTGPNQPDSACFFSYSNFFLLNKIVALWDSIINQKELTGLGPKQAKKSISSINQYQSMELASFRSTLQPTKKNGDTATNNNKNNKLFFDSMSTVEPAPRSVLSCVMPRPKQISNKNNNDDDGNIMHHQMMQKKILYDDNVLDDFDFDDIKTFR